MIRPKPGGKASQTNSKSKLAAIKRALKRLGGPAIDGRTTLAKALAQFRADLVQDLGGPAAISTQQAALVDLVVKTKLLIDTVDNWLLTHPSLVNGRKRALHPVVLQRQQLADSLARFLGQLGLEHRARPIPLLEEYLARSYGESRELEISANQDEVRSSVPIKKERIKKSPITRRAGHNGPPLRGTETSLACGSNGDEVHQVQPEDPQADNSRSEADANPPGTRVPSASESNR